MKTTITTEEAPKAIGPYSQAVSSGGLLFLSGQLGLDPATQTLVEGIRAQTDRSMKNLGAVLEKAGLKFADVVKTTIFLQDMRDFQTVNEVYGSFFPSEPPARSTVQAAALPKGGLVEIEMIAKLGG